MKRILSALVLTAFFLLAGCGEQIEPLSGAYFPEGADMNDADSVSPFLTLDSEQQSFILLYDTIAYGTYTVEGDTLTATVQGGQSAYEFEVQDEQTLALQVGDGQSVVFHLVETADTDTSSGS